MPSLLLYYTSTSSMTNNQNAMFCFIIFGSGTDPICHYHLVVLVLALKTPKALSFQIGSG